MQRRTFIHNSVAAAAAAVLGACSNHRADIAADRSAALRGFIAERMARGKLLGASAALVENGRLAWAEGFGMADRNAGAAMSPATVVGIGSVTKTFTSLAIMQLRRRGLLDINAPITRYVPQLRIGTRGADLQQVTVRSLMNHTSGLPTDVFKYTELEKARYTDVVDLLNDTELAAWPQTIGLYSNIGYSLLGVAIRNVSGEDYRDYLKRHVLAPLNMSHSGFAGDAALSPLSVLYYADGRTAPAFELRDQPAGGVYSNVEDLARYAIAMMDAWHGKSTAVIDADSVRLMFTPSNENLLVESNRKGLGWFTFRNSTAFAMYHAGSTGFANAALLLFPQTRDAAVILVNTVGGDRLANEYAFDKLKSHGLKVGDIRPAPRLPALDKQATPVVLSAEMLKQCAGAYARKRDFALVSRDGNDLLLVDGDETLRLKSLSDGSFQPFATAAATTQSDLDGVRYRFADAGPYHVLFRIDADGVWQQGYRQPDSATAVAWRERIGRYELFGYQIQGNERIVAAEINAFDTHQPRLQLVYNTGKFAYPLIFSSATHAVTGGLGPQTTGEVVRFSDDGSQLFYSGLTFRKV